jgi:hypothetical protein
MNEERTRKLYDKWNISVVICDTVKKVNAKGRSPSKKGKLRIGKESGFFCHASLI